MKRSLEFTLHAELEAQAGGEQNAETTFLANEIRTHAIELLAQFYGTEPAQIDLRCAAHIS